jgi:hypothetical protein
MQYSFSLNNFGVSPSASNPGNSVSEVVWLLSHQRGKKPTKKTKQTEKTNKKAKNKNKTKQKSQIQMKFESFSFQF